MSIKKQQFEHLPDSGWLLLCLEQVLTPIVRLFLNQRVGFGAFTEVVRRIYIQQAKEEAIRSNPRQPVTVSEVAWTTGIDSKTVAKYLNEPESPPAPQLSPESMVLSEWAENPTYLDQESGKPLELPVRGNGLTFATLVRRTQRNVSYGPVLDALIASGNVRMSADGRSVQLIERWYAPYRNTLGAIHNTMSAACRCLSHFVDTLNHNVDEVSIGRSDTFYQQERYTRKLTPEQADDFRRQCMDLLRKQTQDSVDVMTPFEAPVQTADHLVAGVGYYYFEKPPTGGTPPPGG